MEIPAYVISLYEAEGRRSALSKTWDQLGIEPEPFLVERDQENAERGCFDSHVRLARHLTANKIECAIIFEDDVRVVGNQYFDWSRITTFMMECEDWDILYLGVIPEKMWLSRYRGIAHVYGNTTHAFILKQPAISVLADAVYDGEAVDVWLKKRFKAYAAFPFRCMQASERAAPSSIYENRSSNGNYEVKDQRFWRNVYLKQFRYCLLKYLARSISCRLRGIPHHIIE